MNNIRMLRVTLPRVINYLLFCGGSFMLGTGIALQTRLPSGREGGHGLQMLGWTRHEWGELHFYVGLAMAVLVVVHLALHWSWMKSAIKSAKAKIGLVGLAVGVLIFVLPLLIPVTGR